MLSVSTTSESALKAKVHQYYDEISKALNPIELLPLLMKEQLLDFNERSVILEDNSKSTYEKSRYILRSLEAKGPSAYSKFLNCVKEEESHMGHDYIVSLLQEKAFGSKHELEESSQLKKAIQEHYKEMMDLSLESLVPLIYSKKLLTEEEKYKFLSHDKSEEERIHLLLLRLETKGPLAHGLFAKCLQNESEHPTHKELYDKLTSSCVLTVVARKQRRTVDEELTAILPRTKRFQRWKLQGPLKGERYNRMMCEFHSWVLNGDWERLEIEAAKYKDYPVPEYEVVACHQIALSWIIRGKPELAIQSIDKAKKIVETKISDDNHDGLLGKGEIHLIRLSRYLKDNEKAGRHLENAKGLLFGIEPGRDSAILYYNEACIAAEGLNERSTERELKDVEELFTLAITDDRSHECKEGLIEYHSLLRLAELYLRLAHYTPTDHNKIRHAQKVLNGIKYHCLPLRSKCLYHQIESDIHLNCNIYDKAKESLEHALDIANNHNFELEISSAQKRLQFLRIKFKEREKN